MTYVEGNSVDLMRAFAAAPVSRQLVLMKMMSLSVKEVAVPPI
jgi:hypothetical protein